MLSELAAAAERCTVVVVFPDEFADEAIRGRVDGLERWHDGPTLVIVTDAPARWTPARERARPMSVVAPSEWLPRLVGLVAAPSGPERAAT